MEEKKEGRTVEGASGKDSIFGASMICIEAIPNAVRIYPRYFTVSGKNEKKNP